MNVQLIPLHILLATAALAMIFVMQTSTSSIHRNTSYYVFLGGLSFTFLGYVMRGMTIALDIDFIATANPLGRTQYRFTQAATVASILIGISLFLKVLLVRSLLGERIVWWHAVMTFCAMILLSFAPFYLFGADIRGVARHSIAMIFFVCCSSLIFFSFYRTRSQFRSLSLRLVYLFAIVIIFLNCVGLIVLFFFLSDIFGDNAEVINSIDLWLRGVRISISFAVDIVLLYFWLQNCSTDALRAADDRSRLEALLKEKELLVSSLLDADALVHTGALAGGLSHELNQFLARIQLDAESAKSYVLANQSPDRIISILNRLTQANQEAAQLIGSLRKLFVKRAEERTLCELDTLVETVVSLYASRIKQSGIDFECHAQTGAEAMLDDGLIRRVISNLLSNALDACSATGRKDLKIRVASQIESGSWVFTVSDNAVGVHPSVMHKVFSLFATTKSEGTGVGLWLSQHIVEIHAGSIRFENFDAGGVKFSFRIPLG